MKIIDKIEEARAEGRAFFSFEFFPPKTEDGVKNLFTRMERMARLEPLYMDVTWGAGGRTSAQTLHISSTAQEFLGVDVLMHLSVRGMTRQALIEALRAAKSAGVQNILALQGDQGPVKVEGDFAHAIGLVRLIREEFGDFFCVGVAGYPDRHPDSPTLEEEVGFLKEKLDAGADFVVTQLFYDVEVFTRYVDLCRGAGITAPIIPGVMPIHNWSGFKRMTQYCRTSVPEHIWEALAPIKGDDAAIKEYGISLGAQMGRQLIAAGAPGLHFYTLNLERSVRRILEEVLDEAGACRRALPWRTSALERRAEEDVRPIFWANRPSSYIHRTANWDEFPNGRWGDARSPAFGDLSDSQFAPDRATNVGPSSERLRHWGESPLANADVYEVFAQYVSGNIPFLPWCDVPLLLETSFIQEQLARINRNGFLTINSQPAVNGAPSDDPAFGWGGVGGVVYQKAYVECFVSPANLAKLIAAVARYPSIRYVASDAGGNTYSNGDHEGATAVTWGVFPNREVLQPTVVDSSSFMVWKDEAFSLWLSMWASLYDEDSPSYHLLHDLHDTYFLLSVVENDFVNGNIWAIFEELIANSESSLELAAVRAASPRRSAPA